MSASRSSYRSQPLRCPGCRQDLLSQRIRDALVDRCEACGGLWVDWQDGDLHRLARAVGSPSVVVDANDLTDATQPMECPLCRRSLHLERCELGGHMPVVRRCSDCIGAFLPSSSVAQLAGAALSPDDEDDPELKYDSVVRWLFGWLFD